MQGQECICLRDQLRQCQSREASLKQGMVGLKAEIQALVEENSGLHEALAVQQCEQETTVARATNAEVSSMCACRHVAVCQVLYYYVAVVGTAADSTGGGRADGRG